MKKPNEKQAIKTLLAIGYTFGIDGELLPPSGNKWLTIQDLQKSLDKPKPSSSVLKREAAENLKRSVAEKTFNARKSGPENRKYWLIKNDPVFLKWLSDWRMKHRRREEILRRTQVTARLSFDENEIADTTMFCGLENPKTKGNEL